MNPDIPISSYPVSELSGTAKFWLKANNLKKYIDVSYDVKPYLAVTPKEFVIYYEAGKPTNTKVVKWDTNLGGIVLDKTTDTKGSSIISMSVKSSDDATGTFTVTATEDPVTTTIHEFKVTSKDGTKSQTVRVTVTSFIFTSVINSSEIDTVVTDRRTNCYTKISRESYQKEVQTTGAMDGLTVTRTV